jgi:hypothetical protein
VAAGRRKIYDRLVSGIRHVRLSGSLNYTFSHPNIVQIFGTAKLGKIHATILHDGATFCQKQIPELIFNSELIPLKDFLAQYRDSHFSTVYIYAYVVWACQFSSTVV